MMRVKIKVLLIAITSVLYLLGGCCYYKYRQSIIEEIAKKTFVKAVDNEAYKLMPNIEQTVGFTGGNILKKDEAPEYIYWYDKSGERKYKIDPKKHWKNVTMDSDVRTIHSYAFEKSSLNPDSLNLSWQNILKEENLICSTGIRMISTDKNEKSTSLLTSDSEWWQNLKPFWNCTIGYRCEIDCLLYLRYSLWQVFGIVGIGYILLFIFLFFAILKVATILQKRTKPEKIIIEKEVLVKEVESNTARLYHLGVNVYFDAEKRKLSEGEISISLTNQAVELLELFLQEENRILSVNTIGEKLWDVDGNYENRVYQVINRLRGFLKQFPSITIDKVSVGSYQLKISEI